MSSSLSSSLSSLSSSSPSAYDIHKILDNLYLGGEDAPQLKYIEKFNIKCIISVGSEFKKEFNTIKLHTSVKYYCIPIADEDSVPIEKYFDLFTKLINYNIKNSIPTLVHCSMGRSRSPSIVIAYLMLYHDMTYQQAFDFINKIRRGIRPNDGFTLKLKQLELKCKKV
jgi:atypical dual specificity phosphatase